MKIILKFSISILLIATILGCSNENKTPIEPQVSNSPIAVTAAKVNNQTDKIKFKSETGADLFSLKQQADGAKLVDAKEQEIVKIKSEKSGKIKFKNPAEKTLGYVVIKQGYWKLENSGQNQELYILKKQPDGDYKLEDGTDKEIYQIKPRENGLEIFQANQQLIYKIKVKGGKTALVNPSEKTIFSTKANISPIAFACFGFDVLTREQQAALAYAVNSTGGQ
ncbi:hypothetical protein [Nostoc sp. FACHB-110]|uniref:hypothetical protein n=1 Tax=Nostoc sp. FACHB-110 TaxID=2692834 RepID=UPI001682729D|nr:hypothetical protein [Nostoc sp. FACHB-110]MBD2438320.1 hypothetical protein [Nostoc sp. FACHB-110]